MDIAYSWPEFDHACFHLGNVLATEFPVTDVLLGIKNGGIHLTQRLSRSCNIPAYYVEYSSKIGNGDSKKINDLDIMIDHEQSGRMIIVDDIVDTGNTALEVALGFYNRGWDVLAIFCIHQKIGHVLEEYPSFEVVSAEIPISRNIWVCYPWENYPDVNC